MAATRLTDSQKSELVARYSAGEGSGELAAAFGCSVNTVSRVVKAALPPDDYERLKQERARASRAGAVAAAPEPVVQSVSDPEPAVVPDEPDDISLPAAEIQVVDQEEISPSPVAKAAEPPAAMDDDDQDPEGQDDDSEDANSEAGDEQDDDSDGTLAIDDADDFGDDGADEEGDDAEGSDEALELPAAAASHEPVSCIPIGEADLPASVYMLVDKTVELEAKPLREFTELGLLPPGEEERQALQVFVNPRNAKRLCGRSQRVIKIPDTRIFERTARYLVAQGISRLVIENGVYSLPGA